jgi:dienelactone hydrolase
MPTTSLTRRALLAGTAAAGVSALWPRSIRAADTGSPSVAWLNEVQQPPAELPADAPQLAPLLVDADGRPIETLAAWEARRVEIQRAWREFLGLLPVPANPILLEVLEEDTDAGVVRQLVQYESEPGLPVKGYLLKPLHGEQTGRVPGVVCLHSTVDFTIRQPAGLEGDAEDFFGLELAKRGYVAFCPRCFLWDDGPLDRSQVDTFHARHPGSKGMAKMLYDAMRAVDILVRLPEVDADRIGAVGHSLGAKETLYLAAFDERVKAAVSSEGGIGTRFSNWDAPWYLGPDINEADGEPAKWSREHHELHALVAQRAFLLLGGDDADGARSWPFIEAVLPVWRLYEPQRPAVGLFNHRQGHSVPPEAQRRLYEWFENYL